ncbi:MAG: hypothetical protein HOQ24_05755 [Mycobacteriaceae bacterium]|nr:hypothetical protein [Mycobacteriaceae bacterium]
MEVYIDALAAAEFLSAAGAVYPGITKDSPLPCFAVLLGTHTDDVDHVRRIAFADNARADDAAAQAEFAENIVPRFGQQYENPLRGWWCAPKDLLRIARQGEAEDLDILGGVHLHPDWHRICGVTDAGATLSEHPTAMDEYLFRNAAWPVHLICYLAEHDSALYHTWAGWRTDPDGVCRRVPVRAGCALPGRSADHNAAATAALSGG